MNTKLKPCPFCGGHAVLYRYGWNVTTIECANYNNDYHRVYMTGDSEADVIAAWNRRAGDEPCDSNQDGR